ncbi:exodeoxyribonuclease VII small subunit [Lolliginicoccus levis]|uniref:exodeoxyribonuclease VII small subunit n=1 Tax=Lolliginicoccus levis TaxID=2919542 RepID=UPI00241E2618|nr:exodeoxyribonuclease VII small subunit [Lolliginicoccus levis]
MSQAEQITPEQIQSRPATATLGYERARDELVDIVRVLEQGGLDLDTSITLWERGEQLADRCEEHLSGARNRIETAIAARGGAEDGEDTAGED